MNNSFLDDRSWKFWLILTSVFLPFVCQGQLVWKTVSIEKAATLTVDTVSIEFPFTNEGKTPATFVSVAPLCSCTTINPMKSVYAPGEKGEVSAIFTVGQRTGLQEKYIDVKTDASSGKIQRLTFKVKMPELATVMPNHLVWKMGDPTTSQKMKLEVKQTEPLPNVQATTDNPNFKVEVKNITPGFKYEIVVTPLRTIPWKAVIDIKTNYPPEKPRTIEAFAEVTPPGG